MTDFTATLVIKRYAHYWRAALKVIAIVIGAAFTAGGWYWQQRALIEKIDGLSALAIKHGEQLAALQASVDTLNAAEKERREIIEKTYQEMQADRRLNRRLRGQ